MTDTPSSTDAASSTSQVAPIPEGAAGIIPHIVVADANAAIAFYVEAFGAVETGRIPGPAGKVLHASVRIGDATLYLADDFPEMTGVSNTPKALGGISVAMHRFVEDVDAAVEKAVAAGATLKMPPMDMFWGDRYAQIVDPADHVWSLATHVRDVTSEEMTAAMEDMARQAAIANGDDIGDL
ncbi:MAG: PhnB protein [Candidatus Poriferisodalaceae bacterium]|jgi:PhnB protein